MTMQKLLRLALSFLSILSRPLAAFLFRLARLKSYLAEKIFIKEIPGVLGSRVTRDGGPTEEEYAGERERFQKLNADDAIKAFEQFSSTDPFPYIAPALLSSRDISDYVAATGILYPF